jgi:hypothetical protein
LAAPARPYRHITGRPLALPLFDAPLDPRLLAAAEAAYEISRIISLARLAPLSGTLPPAIQLLQTGACDFALPETLFDADYPGHYQRQLKRVSVTLV